MIHLWSARVYESRVYLIDPFERRELDASWYRTDYIQDTHSKTPLLEPEGFAGIWRIWEIAGYALFEAASAVSCPEVSIRNSAGIVAIAESAFVKVPPAMREPKTLPYRAVLSLSACPSAMKFEGIDTLDTLASFSLNVANYGDASIALTKLEINVHCIGG